MKYEWIGYIRDGVFELEIETLVDENQKRHTPIGLKIEGGGNRNTNITADEKFMVTMKINKIIALIVHSKEINY